MSLILSGSDGISDIDGTAATPAIRGTDANTGIFFPAADTIAFSEGGAEAMRITSTGEVLVGGTTSLSAKKGALSIQNNAGNDYPVLNLFRDDTTVSATNPLGRINFYGNDTTSNTPTVLAYIEASPSGAHAAGDNPTDIVFATTPDGTEAVAEAVRITAAGLLQFNSGYGSVATAYGCRAWVNFNGTGTIAIRASGNVSSITDNGTGDYTVNFTTAMPDVDYAISGATNEGAPFDNSSPARILQIRRTAPTTTTSRFAVTNFGNSNQDVEYVYVQIFR